MSELQEFQKLVISNAANVKGLSVGSFVPDFSLQNALGKEVSLYETLKNGIVILKFYRGEWCPICNLDLREMQKYSAEITSLGAIIMAISPQKPDDALTISQKNDIGFEVLSDANQKVIKEYNLQFDPGDDYHNRRDLTLLNGDGSKTLPVPATFIIDKTKKIIASHIEADYTQRMSPSEIINVLKKMNN